MTKKVTRQVREQARALRTDVGRIVDILERRRQRKKMSTISPLVDEYMALVTILQTITGFRNDLNVAETYIDSIW